MKYLLKKIYLILLLVAILSSGTAIIAKDNEIEYSREDISNYFSGIISANQDSSRIAFGYLNEVQTLKSSHFNFNVQFINTLILLEKFHSQ